jgi:hypothetical protein
MPHQPTPRPRIRLRSPAKLVRNLLNQVITGANGKKWPLRLRQIHP